MSVVITHADVSSEDFVLLRQRLEHLQRVGFAASLRQRKRRMLGNIFGHDARDELVERIETDLRQHAGFVVRARPICRPVDSV